MLNYKSSPRPIANTFSKKIPRKTNLGRKAMGQLSDQVIILPLAGASLLTGAVQFSHRAYKVLRNMLKLFDSCAKNKQLFFSRSFSLRSNVSLQFGSNSFYPKLLNETRPRKPARRRSLPLATQQKSFLRFS